MKNIHIEPNCADFYSALWRASCLRLVHLANKFSHYGVFPRYNIDAMLNAIDILEDIGDMSF